MKVRSTRVLRLHGRAQALHAAQAITAEICVRTILVKRFESVRACRWLSTSFTLKIVSCSRQLLLQHQKYADVPQRGIFHMPCHFYISICTAGTDAVAAGRRRGKAPLPTALLPAGPYFDRLAAGAKRGVFKR